MITGLEFVIGRLNFPICIIDLLRDHAIIRIHVMESRLDATCCAMALTSCFAKIGTFCNEKVVIITPLFPPSPVANVIADTS